MWRVLLPNNKYTTLCIHIIRRKCLYLLATRRDFLTVSAAGTHQALQLAHGTEQAEASTPVSGLYQKHGSLAVG